MFSWGTMRWLCLYFHFFERLCCSRWSRRWVVEGYTRAYKYFSPFQNKEQSETSSCQQKFRIIRKFTWVRIHPTQKNVITTSACDFQDRNFFYTKTTCMGSTAKRIEFSYSYHSLRNAPVFPKCLQRPTRYFKCTTSQVYKKQRNTT